MDREITPDVRRRRVARRVAVAAITIAAAIFFLAATLDWLRPSVRRRDVRIARVDRGAVDATLQASGTVVPAFEQVVSSPVEARVLRVVRRAGDRVQAGDPLLTLDTSASRLDFDRLEERLARKENESLQLRIRLEDSIASQRAQIEQRKLDAEIFHLRAQQNARLFREGLVSEQDNLAAAAAAKKSDIELAQLADALVRSQRNASAQLEAAEMDVRLLRRERDESRRQLDLAMMRADRAGIVTWSLQEEGATVRRGDVIARIADLSAFRVTATISDIHSSSLGNNMPVRVRLDETTTVSGRIASVDPRIENGVARFSVELDARAHPKLRNNLRVDVFVVTGRRENVLRVARGNLAPSAREEVFVIRGDDAVRVPVRFGLAGEEHIEITNGVDAGDQVVISDMSEYAEVKKLKLK
ncbi:MAG TPA: HlyD family efflux transporter periplasmic adaptor subunit [Thermoanaerobaculia bacterium]|nr:HlyD family efflux transporter periplasmic adaptor subunit [Thermoanaerobaculia bacterium]